MLSLVCKIQWPCYIKQKEKKENVIIPNSTLNLNVKQSRLKLFSRNVMQTTGSFSISNRYPAHSVISLIWENYTLSGRDKRISEYIQVSIKPWVWHYAYVNPLKGWLVSIKLGRSWNWVTWRSRKCSQNTFNRSVDPSVKLVTPLEEMSRNNEVVEAKRQDLVRVSWHFRTRFRLWVCNVRIGSFTRVEFEYRGVLFDQASKFFDFLQLRDLPS